MIPDLHLVMHGVAIRKHGSAEDIASALAMPAQTVVQVLAKAVATDRVADVGGKYVLSAAGQMILLGEYSRFYDDLRGARDFVDGYQRFEIINRDVKQSITDWQTLEIAGKRVANDHSDRDYDETVIGRIGDLHERFEPILDRMMARVPRFAVYKAKLGAALEKAEDGAIEWVSDARKESYHTVWFEMHEDLLRILGRVRDE